MFASCMKSMLFFLSYLVSFHPCILIIKASICRYLLTVKGWFLSLNMFRRWRGGKLGYLNFYHKGLTSLGCKTNQATQIWLVRLAKVCYMSVCFTVLSLALGPFFWLGGLVGQVVILEWIFTPDNLLKMGSFYFISVIFRKGEFKEAKRLKWYISLW